MWRIVICQTIEGCSLREIVVRIDDSEFLRRFVHIYNDPMINDSTFCWLRNRITPETWKQINNTLAQAAADRVMQQAHQRVIEDQQVPNDQKLFSIFEPHTELLIRGKAGKPIEFGHMIQIQQVEEKFITHYDVIAKRPVEPELVEPAIERHRKLFGNYPNELTTDKGYYGSREQLATLREKIDLVAINKKGKRSKEEAQRESDPFFRHAQRFRAGVEGTTSYESRGIN